MRNGLPPSGLTTDSAPEGSPLLHRWTLQCGSDVSEILRHVSNPESASGQKDDGKRTLACLCHSEAEMSDPPFSNFSDLCTAHRYPGLFKTTPARRWLVIEERAIFEKLEYICTEFIKLAKILDCFHRDRAVEAEAALRRFLGGRSPQQSADPNSEARLDLDYECRYRYLAEMEDTTPQYSSIC